MSQPPRRSINLSFETRALLEALLEAEGLTPTSTQRIHPRKATGPVPLSYAQERLWFLDQLQPGIPAFNSPKGVRLKGPLNTVALERSLNEIVQRHEALRTTFRSEAGRPVQLIVPSRPPRVQVVDLRALPESVREERVMELAQEAVREPFDLEIGSLLRMRLLRLADEEHVLLLVVHHIVYDGWSMGVLMRELGALYEAFSADKPSPLPELPIQYADFAVWQREWLEGGVLAEQLPYWKQQLGGELPVLALPTDRPRPAVSSHRGRRHFFSLPPSLSDALKRLSQQEGATLFMTLLAAFQLLLFRYSGQEDILVGSPIANRNRVEIEGLIGFFVNTLVLRTDLSGNPTFRELLGRVREVALGAYSHQDTPFEKLVEELQPHRDAGHPPLIQVMFVMQNAPTKPMELAGLQISPVDVDTGTWMLDFTLSMTETSAGLRARITYNMDLFDPETVERLAGHYRTLLEGVATDPQQRLSQLPLLTEAERKLVLVEWNDTQREYPRDRCIQELFEAQVEQAPESLAVVFEEKQLTFRQLNQRANQLAHHLRSLGVGPDVLVGICIERSVEMVVGLLGILKSGGAYLPLDPSSPKERLAFMLADAQPRVLLMQQHLVQDLPKGEARVVCLDADQEVIAQERKDNPINVATAADLAYVIYTSGSTGSPKGVMVQHRSVLNLWMGLTHTLYAHVPRGRLRISLNASLSFDASVKQLVMLLHGHTLYVLPEEIRPDGEGLLAYLRGHRLDVLDCVPSQLKLLLAAGLLDGSGWAPSLVLVGGEAIDEATWQMLAQAAETDFYNLYGPTECTVDASLCFVRSSPMQPTIGRPLVNTQLYILDAQLQPVPIGVPGELHIGGAGLSRGYLNRPELTAETFIPHPFSDEPGARLYKTGDRARYLPDGNIEFLGRLDQQVKVRGNRIELGEIEAVLGKHPGVRECVVLAREDAPGEKRLIAYIVPTAEPGPAVAELRRSLGVKLPAYMVPSVFLFLAGLPLTPSGKVDHRALPAPDASRPELETRYVAPRGPVDEALAEIWAELLGLERVGIHDNFFELGGHSLLATQVIARVRSGLHVEVPLRCLFETPTVAGLAEVVTNCLAAAAEQEELAQLLSELDGQPVGEAWLQMAGTESGASAAPDTF